MLLTTLTARAQDGDAAPDSLRCEIEQVLDLSMNAWNSGDLAGFLDCYEVSPQTSYLTSDRIVIGYTEIASVYAERFDTVSAARRGELSLSLTRVIPLSAEHSLAIGRYLLSRDESYGGPGDGVFSLVLRKTSAGWRIAADHTSA
jgi:uncharacterized protein (TIGR02246 family)